MNKKYAIIENALVINVAVASLEYAQSQGWISCTDDVAPGWSYVNNVFTPPAPYIPSANDNKLMAVNLLQQTDWTSIADVGNSALSTPYLINQAEFFTWRSQIRAIAVNPTAGELEWPKQPSTTWS